MVISNDQIRLTGIILAGGKGIRLGMNKGLAKLGNRHLVEYVIENLSQVCSEILISSNTDQCKKFGFKTIPDIYDAKGPMAGIHACLKASSNEHNFVVSVDTPFVSPDFIRYMFGKKEDGLIAAPWYKKDYYEPLCAYYNKRAIPKMEEHFEHGRFKLPDLYKEVPFSRVEVNETMLNFHPLLFHNINTQEDLLTAERYLSEYKAI